MRHFYPLCVVDKAIIPRVTDKLLGVIDSAGSIYFSQSSLQVDNLTDLVSVNL